MFDFTKLWDKTYLFGPNPADLSRSDLIFFWIALVFILASAISRIYLWRLPKDSPNRFLYTRFFHLFLTTSLLVLLWVGSRFENIPWLGAHIVVLILLLIALVWLFFIGKYYIREFKGRQQRWKEDQIKQKYLR